MGSPFKILASSHGFIIFVTVGLFGLLTQAREHKASPSMPKLNSVSGVIVEVPENKQIQLDNGLKIRHLKTDFSSQSFQNDAESSPSISRMDLKFELEFKDKKKIIFFTPDQIGVIPKTEDSWLHFIIYFLSVKIDGKLVVHQLKVETAQKN